MSKASPVTGCTENKDGEEMNTTILKQALCLLRSFHYDFVSFFLPEEQKLFIVKFSL